jgi:hypothetical protein
MREIGGCYENGKASWMKGLRIPRTGCIRIVGNEECKEVINM